MDLPEAKLYTISQAGKILGVSPKTLKRWEKSGKIKIPRTPTGNRFFTKESLETLKNNLGLSQESAKIEIARTAFHFPTLSKPSYRFSAITAILIVSILANFFLFSKTDYPHQAVLGVETFVAPVLEESAPLGSFFSRIGGFFRNNPVSSFALTIVQKIEQPLSPDLTVSGRAQIASDIEGLGNLKIKGTASVGKLVTGIVDPYLIVNDGTIQPTLEIKSTGDISLEPGVDNNVVIGNISLGNNNSISGVSSLISTSLNTTTLNTSTLTTTSNAVIGTSLETKKDLTVDGNITLSGVINSNTFTSTNLTFAGSSPSISAGTTNTSISLNGNGTGGVNLQSGSTGDINFFSTSNKITSSGNLTIGGAYNVGGASGKTISACGSSQYLGGIAVTGGIITTLGSCTSIPSSTWNSLQNPTANLSLSMAAYTTTFTWNAATGASTNLFNLTDTTNNTGTGYLLTVGTQSGSSLKPLQVQALGSSIIDTTAAGVLTLGNSTLAQNVQFFSSSNTITSGGALTLAGSVSIGTNPATTGTIRVPNTNADFFYARNNANTANIPILGIDSSDRIFINGGGGAAGVRLGTGLDFGTDNAFDIGALGANRPRSGYFGTNLSVGVTAAPAGGDAIYIPNNTGIDARNGAGGAWIPMIYLDASNYTVVAGSGGAGLKILNGPLLFSTDNASDIGASGANRARNLYVAGFVSAGGSPATSGYLRVPNIDGNLIVGNITTDRAIAAQDQANGFLYIGSDKTGALNYSQVRFAGVSTTASAANAFLDGANGNSLYRSTSSLRYKNLIGDLSLGDAQHLILNAQPIVYTSRSKADNPNTIYVGFAAEQIATVDARFITYDEQHLPNWVQYPVFTAPLTLVAQNHEKRILNLEAETNNLLTTVGLPTPTPSASPSPTPTPTPTPTPIPNSILSRLDILEKSVLSASSSASFDTLTVLKKLTATDLGLTGKLTQGLLSINGLDSTVASGSATINTISNDLYLQNLGVGGVNFINGKVTIDKNGNLKLDGGILTVKGASVGSAVLPAGTTSLDITTSVATSTSKIFITASSKTGKQPLLVTNKSAGKFTVSIEDPYVQDIPFDWWIIETQ